MRRLAALGRLAALAAAPARPCRAGPARFAGSGSPICCSLRRCAAFALRFRSPSGGLAVAARVPWSSSSLSTRSLASCSPFVLALRAAGARSLLLPRPRCARVARYARVEAPPSAPLFCKAAKTASGFPARVSNRTLPLAASRRLQKPLPAGTPATASVGRERFGPASRGEYASPRRPEVACRLFSRRSSVGAPISPPDCPPSAALGVPRDAPGGGSALASPAAGPERTPAAAGSLWALSPRPLFPLRYTLDGSAVSRYDRSPKGGA